MSDAGQTTMTRGSVPQKHLLDDEADFDRLAKAHVIGDEEVHSRHGERSGHRF